MFVVGQKRKVLIGTLRRQMLPFQKKTDPATGHACRHIDLASAMKKTTGPWGQTAPEFEECLASLEAAFLIERLHISVDGKVITQFRLTRHGGAFLRACIPPCEMNVEGETSNTRPSAKAE